jgi:cobalt/nickel transport system permease protein
MHLSDGFLDPSTAIITSAATAGAVGLSVWQLRREIISAEASVAQSSAMAGKMALVGAGVFAAQAVNFPLAGGVSGHLLGGVAAAALLGPWAGILVVAAVLAVQCLLLGDGGLSALGANIFNMAVLGAVLGGPVHAMVRRGMSAARQATAGGFAAAAALPLGALACAAEMHVAGKAAFAATSGEMLPMHWMLAVAEGLFTAAVVLAARRSAASAGEERSAARWTAGTLVAVLLATVLFVPFSSPLPDTLESAAERMGVIAADPYVAAAVDESTFAAAGARATAVLPILLGTLVAFAATGALARGLHRATIVPVRKHERGG